MKERDKDYEIWIDLNKDLVMNQYVQETGLSEEEVEDYYWKDFEKYIRNWYEEDKKIWEEDNE